MSAAKDARAAATSTPGDGDGDAQQRRPHRSHRRTPRIRITEAEWRAVEGARWAHGDGRQLSRVEAVRLMLAGMGVRES